MSIIALLTMFVALAVGSAWIVFPSPATLAAVVAALGCQWFIEFAACAAAIRRNQAAGAVVNFVALRCIGYATTITGIVAVCIVAVRVVFTLILEAPAP